MKYFIYGYPPTYTYTIKITPSIDKRLEFMGIVCIRISSEYTYVNMIIYVYPDPDKYGKNHEKSEKFGIKPG